MTKPENRTISSVTVLCYMGIWNLARCDCVPRLQLSLHWEQPSLLSYTLFLNSLLYLLMFLKFSSCVNVPSLLRPAWRLMLRVINKLQVQINLYLFSVYSKENALLFYRSPYHYTSNCIISWWQPITCMSLTSNLWSSRERSQLALSIAESMSS